MYQKAYFVPKFSGTLSDLLLAFGAATVFRSIAHQHIDAAEVVLVDLGFCYGIELTDTLDAERVEASQLRDLIPYLTDSKRTAPTDLPLLAAGARNVDEEWDTFRRYREQRKQLGENGFAGEELEQQVADLRPKPEWTVATYLGDYRMQAQDIHNKLVEQWHRCGIVCRLPTLNAFLSLFSGLDADWGAIAQTWKKEVKGSDLGDTVTASQLFNPHMGKGQNQAKASKLTMGNEKSFWLTEYLKAAGLWIASSPTKTIRKAHESTKAKSADLRKTYVLAPRRVEMEFHLRVFNEFRQRLWNTGAVKQDIMASLLYTEVLLERAVSEDMVDIFDDGPISNVVAGMSVATYQLLSANSYTTMNLAFLGLPDWMPQISSRDDARDFRDVLHEHRVRIRSIDEDTSEGYALLQLYRDFISGNYLEPFFEFLTGYSSYLISAIDRSRFYVKPFTEVNMRRLLIMVNESYAEIIDNEGFRNIADAIRKSTLTPLYLGRSKTPFNIRYGLGQDFMRKAQYKDDFLQVLAEFMHDYNEETMRVHERTKGAKRRKLITTHDIEHITKLVDRHKPKTICNLLVAYGYARNPREVADPASAEGEEMEVLEGEEFGPDNLAE